MTDLARHLRRAILAAAVPIQDVSIGNSSNKGTWTVIPSSLQAQAQPVIDGFNPDDPAHAAADTTEQAQLTSRQKDVLTTCALIVRARNIPAWNAMTVPQKVTAAFAEADVWRDVRIWAEANL